MVEAKEEDAGAVVIQSLIVIAAMYVDLADQLLGQQEKGALPGILYNREKAWELGCIVIGPEEFQKLIDTQKE